VSEEKTVEKTADKIEEPEEKIPSSVCEAAKIVRQEIENIRNDLRGALFEFIEGFRPLQGYGILPRITNRVRRVLERRLGFRPT